jgi:hypothetical protein
LARFPLNYYRIKVRVRLVKIENLVKILILWVIVCGRVIDRIGLSKVQTHVKSLESLTGERNAHFTFSFLFWVSSFFVLLVWIAIIEAELKGEFNAVHFSQALGGGTLVSMTDLGDDVDAVFFPLVFQAVVHELNGMPDVGSRRSAGEHLISRSVLRCKSIKLGLH